MNIRSFDGTDGYPEKVGGTGEWYACMTGTSAEMDAYEAEEAVKSGSAIHGGGCVLIHYPDGKTYRPFSPEKNVYVGVPVYDGGAIFFYAVDFGRAAVRIYRFSAETEDGELLITAEIPLSEVRDCYNLALQSTPLSLVRQGNDCDFEILYPERSSFSIGERESFLCREDNLLFFTEWSETEHKGKYDYSERLIVRDLAGKIISERAGFACLMDNGEIWLT